MKEYTKMYKVDYKGNIEEIAMSMITKDGFIKYYPKKNGKVYKLDGISYGNLNSWSDSCGNSYKDNLEEAEKVSKELKCKYLTNCLEKTQSDLSNVENNLISLKEQYLDKRNRYKDYQKELNKKIKEYNKQIEELNKGDEND